VIASYERTASEALDGARAVRDDTVVYLRAVQLVVESVAEDHLSHAEAKTRLRGVLSVLSRNVASLRDEAFDFKNSVWRRGRDLYRWDGPERALREQNDKLRDEVKSLRDEVEALRGPAGAGADG
jgi:hypothetical protein